MSNTIKIEDAYRSSKNNHHGTENTSAARRLPPSRLTAGTRAPMSAKRNADGDSVEITQDSKAKRRELAKKRKKAFAIKNQVIGALLALSIINGGKAAINNITAPHADYDTTGHSIVQVADYNDIAPQAILLANGLETTQGQDVLDKIILPQKYDIYGEQIAELVDAMTEPDITEEEKSKLKAQLENLFDKQKEIDDVALTYTDDSGKWFYAVPNPDSDEKPRLEEIKEIYGIEDGVIKSYNNIDYEWNYEDENDTTGFRDYRYSYLPESGIRIPLNKIGKAEKE